MNGWRWFGTFLLLAGVTALVNLPAAGQDKDKKGGTKAAKDKADAKTDAKAKEKAKEETAPKEKAKETGKETGGKGQPEFTLKAFEGTTPFYQELNTKTTQKMTVMSMKHEQVQNQTFWFSWTPKEKKDGKYTVVQKILGVKMDIDIGGNKISYDSTAKDAPKNPMSEFFKALIDQEFTIIIGKDKAGKYQVEEVKGVGNLVNKLGNINPQMTQLLKQILTEDTIKQMAEPMLGVIPPNGTPPAGGNWTNTNTLDMGPIGKYTTKNKYTIEEKGKEKVKDQVPIKVETDLTYAAPQAGEKNALPFKILSAKLASKDSGGTIVYNTDKGRVESADMKINLAGDLNIEIANMQTTVALDQVQDTKLKTMDKNPVPASK
jgi:hypothetical protein